MPFVCPWLCIMHCRAMLFVHAKARQHARSHAPQIPKEGHHVAHRLSAAFNDYASMRASLTKQRGTKLREHNQNKGRRAVRKRTRAHSQRCNPARDATPRQPHPQAQLHNAQRTTHCPTTATHAHMHSGTHTQQAHTHTATPGFRASLLQQRVLINGRGGSCAIACCREHTRAGRWIN